MAKILYSDNFSNRLISNTIFHLLNFEKHSSFQEALRQAAINNDFQIIILSEDFNPILTVETRHDATIADAIRLGKERQVEKQPDEVYTIGVFHPVIFVGILNFELLEDKPQSYHSVYRFLDTETYRCYCEDIELHYLEIPKLKKLRKTPQTGLERMLSYMRGIGDIKVIVVISCKSAY